MNRFQQVRTMLGSEIILTIVVPETINHAGIFKIMWQYLENFDNRFSRFKKDSELSLFNMRAGKNIAISQEFYKLLQVSKHYMKATKGLFNPFVLPSLQQAGYKGSWPSPSVQDQSLDFSNRSIASAQDLKLTPTTASIPEQSAFDSGGIGKGYALDELADILTKKGVNNFCLSLGGDIICSGVDINEEPWEVAIESYNNSAESVAQVKGRPTSRLAIATSGVTKRRGENWHHIIDPRSRNPSNSDVLVASVVSQSATVADIYAKCLVINPTISLPDEVLGILVQKEKQPPEITEIEKVIYA